MTEAYGPDEAPGLRRRLSVALRDSATYGRRARMRLRRIGVRVRPLRRPSRVAGVCLIALLGAWIGAFTFGAAEEQVGPVHTTMRFSPSPVGKTVVEVPPLGSLELDSHWGPMRFDIQVDSIDAVYAQEVLNDPRVLQGLEQRVIDDLRSGLIGAGLRGLAAAVLGAVVVTLVVIRRWRPVLLGAAVAATTVVGAYGLAWTTWDQRSIAEPRYTGLLTGAPSLVGGVNQIVENFGQYRQSLTKIVTNVTQLYDASSSLPTYQAEEDVIRLLHISDMELNEYAWDIVEAVADQYSVDLIVDTGDTTDHGTRAENIFLSRIADFAVPYVWVRGNHDSSVTQAYMETLENVVVLEGQVEEVEGIRFLGAGDPRFTPDRSNRNTEAEERAVAAQAEALVNVAEEEKEPIDILAYHDASAASVVDGHASLFLAGHLHHRERLLMPGGTRLMQEGSTGGDGLRAFEQGSPAPIEMSLLYLNSETQALEAWDEITLGGLGLTSAQIERFHVEITGEDEEVTEPDPIETPTEPAPESPLPTPTVTSPPAQPPLSGDSLDGTEGREGDGNDGGDDEGGNGDGS